MVEKAIRDVHIYIYYLIDVVNVDIRHYDAAADALSGQGFNLVTSDKVILGLKKGFV